MPAAAVEAARRRIELEAGHGRSGKVFFEGVLEMAQSLRAAYARVLRSEAQQVALTGSTTDGVNTVLAGLDLRPGDEILTTDEEHPGLLAPLGQARRRQGIQVRVVPFGRVAEEVSSDTRLVACSHVSWVSGRVVDAGALKHSGASVLLDAAQAIGAIPVDVEELGCDFYAASGQKWLCGPEGSGCLYIREERLDECSIPWPSYGSLADPQRPLDVEPAEGAARFDHGFPSGLRSAWALASLEVLGAPGWDWVHARAAELARTLADRLRERGAVEVLPRGESTLVSWRPLGRSRSRPGGRAAGRGRVHRAQHSFPRRTDPGLCRRLVLRRRARGAGRGRQRDVAVGTLALEQGPQATRSGRV